MPTYEYRCLTCGHQFEVVQRMSDEPITVCPECGKKTQRIVSGGVGFLFRGEGFYITETRSKEYREKARADAQAGATASDGGSGGSDTGPKTDGGGGDTSGSAKVDGGGSSKSDSGGSSKSDSGGSSKSDSGEAGAARD